MLKVIFYVHISLARRKFLTDYLRCVTTSAPCKGQYQSGDFKQQQDSYNDSS